jgi:hypothetical protein
VQSLRRINTGWVAIPVLVVVSGAAPAKSVRFGDWENCQTSAKEIPLDFGKSSFRKTAHPGEGGQESLTTQYFIFLPAAFFRISSAVTMEAPEPSLAAMPEQYTPARNCAEFTASTQA